MAGRQYQYYSRTVFAWILSYISTFTYDKNTHLLSTTSAQSYFTKLKYRIDPPSPDRPPPASSSDFAERPEAAQRRRELQQSDRTTTTTSTTTVSFSLLIMAEAIVLGPVGFRPQPSRWRRRPLRVSRYSQPRVRATRQGRKGLSRPLLLLLLLLLLLPAAHIHCIDVAAGFFYSRKKISKQY